MPTIGHLVVGVVISVLLYYIYRKNFTVLMGLIFVFGSVLPDTFTILKQIFFLLDKGTFNAPHGVVAWIWWALIFATIFKILICLFKLDKKKRLKFVHIYMILLSAGWLHLGLDMLTDPVRLFWKYNISIHSFYTPYEIITGEQDVIVLFYLFFMLIPIVLLLIVIKNNNRCLLVKHI